MKDIETTAAVAEPWDGRPLNPERDGWHWLQAREDNERATMREPFPCKWRGPEGMRGGWVDGVYGSDYANANWRYLGPCLTPAEAAAAEARARDAEQMREAIQRHRANVWGDGAVGHDEDTALYATLGSTTP